MKRKCGIWKILLNQSIQRKLNLFFGVLVLIPLLFFGMTFSIIMRNMQMEQIEKNSSHSLNECAREVEYTLSEMNNIMISSLWDEDLTRFLNTESRLFSSPDEKKMVKRRLKSIANARKDVECLILAAKNGERFYEASSDISHVKFDAWIREEERGRSAQAQKKYEHSRTIWCGLDGEANYVLGVHKIRSAKTLEFCGTLYIFINEETIRNKYVNLKSTPGSFFLIQDEAGRMVSCDREAETEALFAEAEGEVFPSGTDEVILSGETYYYKMVEEKTNGWMIAEFSPKKEILKNVYRMQKLTLAILFITAGVVIITIFYFSRTLMAPIEKLREKMLDVQQGNLDVKAEIMYTDELGELTETFNNMTIKMKRLIEEDYKSKLLLRETEFKFLRAQINPHFLYNTLDSISWIASMKGDKEASNMSVALGRILRWAISNTENLVDLEEELQNVKDYLSIQQMRYGNSLNYLIAVEEEEMKKKVPKMILQPLVENALIHGLEMKKSEKKIILAAQEQGDAFVVSVIDNGIGMTKERICQVLNGKVKQEKQHGVGIYNVHQRIQMHYGEEYGIRILSEPGERTEIQMWMPKQNGEKR